MRGDARAKAIAIDGWTALTAYVPPVERRGVVLIDPPFEQPDEFARLAQGLAAAHRKWPTGIYLLWYPIKDQAEVAAFARRLARLGIAKMLRVELIAANRRARHGFARQRADRRQPALDPARRTQGAAAGAGRGHVPRCNGRRDARLAYRRIRVLTPFCAFHPAGIGSSLDVLA